MKSIPRIARMLRQTLEGDPYYGPSVLGALQGVTAAAAGRRLPGQAHSLWEIVAHITAEYDYACAVLEGNPGPWIEGVTTWPHPRKPSVAGWALAKTDLRKAGRRLARAVARLDDRILDKKPPAVRGPYYTMLHGTIQHAVFHAGEISFLASLLGRRARASVHHPDG